MKRGVVALLVCGLVGCAYQMKQGTKLQVASGEYNEAIDQKILEIQAQCGLM